jgi:hypothetical protein
MILNGFEMTLSNSSKRREHLAFEYKQVMSNFYQLHKAARKNFHAAASNDAIKLDLYKILQEINRDILDILASGDLIGLELLDNARDQVASMREEMKAAVESDDQAKF